MTYQKLITQVWWHTFVEPERSLWFVQLSAAAGARKIRLSIFLQHTDDPSSAQEVSSLDLRFTWRGMAPFVTNSFFWISTIVSTHGKSSVAAPLKKWIPKPVSLVSIWFWKLWWQQCSAKSKIWWPACGAADWVAIAAEESDLRFDERESQRPCMRC